MIENNQVRRILREELRTIINEEYESLLDEAGERRIVRPPGTAMRHQPEIPTEPIKRPAINSIGDIQANVSSLRPGSVFVANSPVFNAVYNMGNDEEMIRFRVKGKNVSPDDERMLMRLVSHVFNEGTYFIVPELFATGQFGVGRIVNITNKQVPNDPGNLAPVALVEFGPGQHPAASVDPMTTFKVGNIGIALIQKISRDNSDETSAQFAQKVKAKAKKPTSGIQTVHWKGNGR